MTTRRIAVASLSLCVLLLLTIFPPTAQAADTSPWMTGTPELSAGEHITLGELNSIRSSRQGFNPGAKCIQKKIETQLLGSLLNRYRTGCWYPTSIGLLHSDGIYLLENGTSRAGSVITHSHTGLRSHLWPTAHPDVLVEQVPRSGSTGSDLHLRSVSRNSLVMDHTVGTLGSITMNYRNSPSLVLRNEGGSPMIASHTSRWWSSDRQYMLIWNNRQGTLYRINMETLEVLRVHVQNRPSGIIMSASVAVSPSNRYAAVAIEYTSVTNLYVIDYDSCDLEPSEYVTNGVNCDIAAHRDQLKSSIPDFSFPRIPRFYGEHTLGFYYRPNNSTGDYQQYFLQANGTEREENKYIALGDSFSSGEGAGDYEPGTDVQGINVCRTSRNSYPYLLNRQFDLDSFLSVACSGAQIEHFDGGKAQYAGSRDVFGDKHPGAQTQKNLVKDNDIATITMSGNDIGFGNKLSYCILASSNCYNTYEQRAQIADEIKRLHPQLVDMYTRILEGMGPKPRLYVLGYPQLASAQPGAQCKPNVQLNSYQRQMANDLITYFNAVIRSAAGHAGAYFVGVESALNGHRHCDDPSAMAAVNGIIAGNDKIFISNNSFHPNILGHELLKQRIVEQTNGLTESMPVADPTTPIPDASPYPFMDVPPSGSPIRKLFYNPKPEPTLLQLGRTFMLEIVNPLLPFDANRTYDVIFHSEPTHVGQVTTDGAGYISEEIEVPETLAPGMHELHIQGIGQDGSPIDVYEFVYVAADENDFYGDGTPDTERPCGIIPPSGVDVDEDGIDDACDPVIGEAPEEPNEPEEPEAPEQPQDPPAEEHSKPNLVKTIVTVLIKLVITVVQKLLRLW